MNNSKTDSNSLLHELKHDGYAVIDLLTSDELDTVKKLVGRFDFEFANNVNPGKLKFHSSFFESNTELKRSFYNQMNAFFLPKVISLLGEYDILITNYWEKSPGDGEVIVHQNWSHVEESKYRSYSIWIPFQETNHENGTMEVVPGSHLVFSKYRGINMEYPKEYPFSSISDEIKKHHLVPINLNPTQAIIIDDAIIHYTAPNNSKTPRKSIQLVVKPEEASGVFYYKHRKENMKNNVEVFDADSEFYIQLQLLAEGNSHPGHGNVLHTFSHRASNISYSDFNQILAGEKLPQESSKVGIKGWLKRFFEKEGS